MDLTIRTCEGGFYLVNLEHSEIKPAEICAKHGISYKDNMRFSSLGTIKEYFMSVSPKSVWLLHNTAYDEMIGLPSSELEHRQPLYWYHEEN